MEHKVDENAIVIGLTGQPSSGKDTVAEYIASRGFVHIPTSDLIRAEMRAQGLPTDRAHIHDFVVEARRKRGTGYLALQAAESVMGKSVISGFRNTAEIDIMRKIFGKRFVLLVVTAPIETRYKWSLLRKREGDQVSFDEFKRIEEMERSGASDSHQVDAVIALADYEIVNDGTREELLKKVEKILSSLLSVQV